MYEGRLQSAPRRERQALQAPASWANNWVRRVLIEHTSNEAASSEEAAVVARIVGDLVGSTWTDADGVTHPVRLGGILVVAPSNAHVGRLGAALPEGAKVGTVNKFQGQVASLAIYSMASSSLQDAPRCVTCTTSTSSTSLSPGPLRRHRRRLDGASRRRGRDTRPAALGERVDRCHRRGRRGAGTPTFGQ
jgi:hypothetical protein